MHKNQKGFIHLMAILTVAIIALVGGLGWYFWQNQQKDHALSEEQIVEKFNCNRLTADYRETDIFCVNSKFFNNPDGVTTDDFYKYQVCEERIKSEPHIDSFKIKVPKYYISDEECNDPVRLNNLRLEFIESLKKLKQENP